MNVQTKVENRIKHLEKGLPFFTHNFYELGSTAAVQKALSRLTEQGVIKRVQRGVYCRPKPLKSIPSITTVASADDVARKWARENGYKLLSHGIEEAYKLGLQTQSPIIKLYWTNGPSREFKVGNQKVKVVQVKGELLKWGNKSQGRLLRALSMFENFELSEEAIKKAFSRLNLEENEGYHLVERISSLFNFKINRSKA